MESFKDIKINKDYDSDRDNLLYDFFIPTLSVTKNYKRLAGFFSSGILSAAARGILGLIENDGHMQLMVGATLHQEDLSVAEDAQQNPEKYLEKAMLEELDVIANMFKNDHIEALGWMLANNLLEIKVGIVEAGGLFHLKVGVMEDGFGNKLSFSGSDNETPSGWRHNIEEFKVFRSWIPEEDGYFNADEEKFDRFWSGAGLRVKTVPLPDAVRKRLISVAPKKKENLGLWKFKDSNDFKSSALVAKKKEARIINLYPHQKKAIEALDVHDGRGILAMATGSGKTLTALSYSKKISGIGPLCTIVAVPYSHLVRQWVDKDILEIFPGAPLVEVHGGSGDWRIKLKLLLHGFTNKTLKNLFIVGIYGSLAGDDFIRIMNEVNIDPKSILYIADEVHNAGAQESQNGLLEIYSRRIGLSATPARYFDEEGTATVLKYFGGIIYEYGIADAIKDNFLTPYNYYPIEVDLSQEEYEKYSELSKKISKSFAIGHGSSDATVKQNNSNKLLLERSRVLKNALGKIPKTREIINRLVAECGDSSKLSHVLIYCDNLKQVGLIQEILNELHIINHKFTEKEDDKQRQHILKNFSNGVYQVLVSVKCLDEGVDIPDARIAIIVASTTNPREYIQRRGRVLRKSPDKKEATIFDLFVVPPADLIDSSDKMEKAILTKEFSRIRDFVNTSKNPSDSYASLLETMSRFSIYL